MRWPFRRRQPQAHPEADAALAQAARASIDADRLGCAVDEAARQLSVTQANNHFGAAAERAMRMRRA